MKNNSSRRKWLTIRRARAKRLQFSFTFCHQMPTMISKTVNRWHVISEAPLVIGDIKSCVSRFFLRDGGRVDVDTHTGAILRLKCFLGGRHLDSDGHFLADGGLDGDQQVLTRVELRLNFLSNIAVGHLNVFALVSAIVHEGKEVVFDV